MGSVVIGGFGGSLGGGGGGTPPAISNVTPAPGTPIVAAQALQFDVTDAPAGLFRRIIIAAQFPALDLYEVVHDGDGYAANYITGSTRSSIANGYRYVVVRRGGWPSSPTLIPYAIDQEGAENP